MLTLIENHVLDIIPQVLIHLNLAIYRKYYYYPSNRSEKSLLRQCPLLRDPSHCKSSQQWTTNYIKVLLLWAVEFFFSNVIFGKHLFREKKNPWFSIIPNTSNHEILNTQIQMTYKSWNIWQMISFFWTLSYLSMECC